MARHSSFIPAGVIPAVLLPFEDDLAIDEMSFRAHLRHVAAVEGLSAVTVNAHSTEVASCTFEEQRRVMEIAADEVGDRLPIVHGVWADGSQEAARIARAAAAGGASALLVFPPGAVHPRAECRDGDRPFQAHCGRGARLADHRLPVSAGDRPGLSAGDAAQAPRCGAADPRHQGLDQQCAAPRMAGAHPAEPAAAGERAVHPFVLADEFAGARLQGACCRAPAASSPTCRRRCSAPSNTTTSPRRVRSTTASIRWPACSMPTRSWTCTTG